MHGPHLPCRILLQAGWAHDHSGVVPLMPSTTNGSAICMEYGSNMYGICVEYVCNMYGMCMELAYPVLFFTRLGPTLMPMVCRLCVVSAPKKRGSVLASSCGGEHAGNVHGMCMESAWNIPSMCTEVHGIAAECDGVWTESVWNTASH